MKNDRIVRAYDRNAPNRETEDRIWQRISMEAEKTQLQKVNLIRGSESESVRLVAKAERPLLRRLGFIAACVAVTVTVLAGGYHGYRRLLQLKPQVLIPGTSGGELGSGARQVGTDPSDKPVQTAEPSETVDSNAEATLTEDEFILQAAEILAQAGIPDVSPENAAVQREAADGRERAQVTVEWKDRETPICVVFDEKDGVLLNVCGFDWTMCADGPCLSQEDADALAERLYHSLPVDQSYVLAGCEKYDEENWMYDFCREVEPGVYSWFECVRLRVNPASGEACFIKAFYVPILDDHKPEDVPLTKEEALAVYNFDSASLQDLESSGRLIIKKAVAVPFLKDSDGNRAYGSYSDVSRICWRIEYHEPEDEDYIAGGWVNYVDYYSGEIIAYDIFG
ncbi:MAG: hypothetical protein IIY70_01240 [Oscillospiraceae bacterium]|nr:hypothetical protein [Oscillospiraceae bacterium]